MNHSGSTALDLQHNFPIKKSNLFAIKLYRTYIPPACDCVCIEVLGNASELVLRSCVMSSHDGFLWSYHKENKGERVIIIVEHTLF